MVAENRRLAAPASVDSLPTSAMQEDHVSMGWGAARKLRASLANLAGILGNRAGCAGSRPGPAGAARARRRHRVRRWQPCGRTVSRAPGPDRWLAPELASRRGARRLRRPGRGGEGEDGRAPMSGPREVRAPRGTEISCRGWQQEAAMRMLMNNLDPEVAERPDELVVYGGTGRAARSWEAFDAIVASPARARRRRDPAGPVGQAGGRLPHPRAGAPGADRQLQPGPRVGDLGGVPQSSSSSG